MNMLTQTGYRIAIVDDEPKNVQVIGTLLREKGFLISIAENGDQALKIIQENLPDLILLDIIMPAMDGIETCRCLKKNPVTKDIPVIFMSALDDVTDKVKAFEAGGVDYITKPFQEAEVLARVRTHTTLFHMQQNLEKLVEERSAEVIARSKELQKSEKQFRRLVENMNDGFGIIDENYLVTYVNDRFCAMLGYLENEVMGRSIMDFFDEENLAVLKEQLALRREGKGGSYEIVWLRKDGSMVPTGMSSSPTFDEEGNYRGSFAVISDITERKLVEEEKAILERQLHQSQKMEAIGTLSGGIAHDFNNILSIILGYSDILKEDIPPGVSAGEELDQIIKAGNRAKDLVNQILAFSRQNKKELIPIQPNLIINEALKMLRASIPTTIKIRHNIPKCGSIIGDPTQLHQIMMNLCTNAYHAMRETGGVLGVLLESIILEEHDRKILSSTLSPGSYLKLEISDTGHGIDKAMQEKIFDPYFTTKKKGEGTGLGLAVVHGVVKSFGGHISVYSESGKGTTFCIYFPKISIEAETQPNKFIEPIPTGDEHILVVDDEKTIVQMEKQMLESLGYQVSICTSSPEAFKIFQNHPEDYALVITDMTMPDMTGVELVQRVRTIRPNIPIILCSGFSELINEEKAKHMGIHKYLMKPTLKRDLAIAIREMLDNDKRAG